MKAPLTNRTYQIALRLYLKRISLACLIIMMSSIWWAPQAQTKKDVETIRIVVQATMGATRTLEAWSATEAVLNGASVENDLPYRFAIVPESVDTIKSAVDSGRADLLLTDAASFVVAEVDYGARAILSTARIVEGRSIDQSGALIFARAEDPYEQLSDLQGRDVMAVAHNDFNGWWLAAQEFRRFRLEPDEHLGQILFSGGNEREVVYAVQSGLVQAGVIQAGALEQLAAAGVVDLGDFRPISQQIIEDFPFWTSTKLYPDRVLSAMPGVPDPVLSLIINTLLDLETDEAAALTQDNIVWQAPDNYQAVHELLVSLRAPPYENYIWQAIVRIYSIYKLPIIAVALAIVASLTFLAYQARKNWVLAEARRNILKSESRSKVFYRSAIEEHTVFCMLTRDGRISHVNERFCELAGQNRTAIIGKELSALLSEKDKSVLAGDVKESMDLNTPWNGHLRIQKSDGRYSWAQCTVIPVIGLEDQLSEVALVATDMTSTQQDVVEGTFNDTLELIEDAVVVFNPSTFKITYCNRAADEMLVKNRMGGKWKDRPIPDLITREDFDALKLRCETVREGPQRRVHWEVDTKDDISYEISLEYVEPELDDPSMVVMYRDVTERKAAERAKSEFVSTVSHELRTPLTSMKGALKMASSGMVGEVPDKMKNLLDMAGRNTDRLVTLINDILDLEKIEAKKMIFNLDRLDMVEVIEQAIEANNFYADKYKVSLVPLIDDADAPYITLGDHDRMMQVMDNLMSNASKFSHEGGEVHISLFRHENWLRMSVRDFGTGIPEASQEKIFDKFVQSDSSDTRAKGGTGLGLAIVKPIVESHNGAISFHSKEGLGTEFFVDLPRVDGDEVSSVVKPGGLVVSSFSECEENESDVSSLTSSQLVQEFEKRLRRSGWATELEAGRVTTHQILSGSGVLGHAIAISLLDNQCRRLISDLIEIGIISNAPVYIMEATMENASSTMAEDDRRGTQVLSDWIKKFPYVIAPESEEKPNINVLLISTEDVESSFGELVKVTRVEDAMQANALFEIDDYDLVLNLRETDNDCTGLILPTKTGCLFSELPMTIFAGQKTAKDTSMGVVTKFGNRIGSGRSRTST